MLTSAPTEFTFAAGGLFYGYGFNFYIPNLEEVQFLARKSQLNWKISRSHICQKIVGSMFPSSSVFGLVPFPVRFGERCLVIRKGPEKQLL